VIVKDSQIREDCSEEQSFSVCSKGVIMEYLVTAEEMKRYDHAAIHELGIGSMVLMERAALAVTEAIKAWLSEHPECDRRVLILAGCGNNGADGLAIGRMLALSAKVEVVVVGNREYATDEWKQQYAILGKYPVKTGSRPSRDEYDVLVDAIFGVGLSREITGPYKEWIDYLNASEGWKVAVDVPSGIDADTGVVRGTAFRADLTVCFAFRKRGLAFYPGCLYAGEVQVKE
jgi:NAD(P)H-hydrate epimerase